MQIGESVVNADGSLKVTLLNLDAKRGKGQIKIEELSQESKWFYVTVKFSKGGENKIDYKTWDVHKLSVHEIAAMNKDDQVKAIEIVSVDTAA